MHRSGSFIRLTSVWIDMPLVVDDSSTQITWLFLLTIVRSLSEGLLKAKIHSLRTENAQKILSTKHHLLSRWHPQSSFWPLRVSTLPPPVLHQWVRLGQNVGPPLRMKSSLPHHLAVLSQCLFLPELVQFIPSLCPASSHSHLAPSLSAIGYQANSCQGSWGLPNVPIDLTIILRAPSLFLTLNSHLSYDPYTVTYHKSPDHC